MRKTTAFLVISLFLLAACVPQQAPTETQVPEGSIIVEVTSTGFSPNPLTVKQGDTVTWINKDTESHWVASAVHPSHNEYPETGGCIGSKFDSCKRLGQGDSWSFTFNTKGSWRYHDHLNPAAPFFGTVVVE